jgi:hypothetical protein
MVPRPLLVDLPALRTALRAFYCAFHRDGACLDFDQKKILFKS